MLQIHLTAGSRKGQRLQAAGQTLAFGREAGNALVIDLPEVSRKHGELVPQADGSWTLVNHSPNGTLVNGKKATTKPVPLAGEVAIRIGEVEILRLTAPAAGAAAGAPAADPAAGTGGKGNLKLGLGIVCGLSVCAILFALLAPMFSDAPTTGPAAATPKDAQTWPRAEIHRLIDEASHAAGETDQALHEALRNKAHALYAPGKPMGRAAWFAAYRAWRLAARANKGDFDAPGDRHDYGVIASKVEDFVWEDYQEAVQEYLRRNDKAAALLLGKILDYAGGEDPLFGSKFRDHLLKLKGLAQSKKK